MDFLLGGFMFYNLFFSRKKIYHQILFGWLLYILYSPSFAVAENITSLRQTTYVLTSDNETIHIQSGGHVNTSGSSYGIDTAGKNNWTIIIDANENQGVVSAIGDAISTSSTTQNGIINVNSGIVQSNTGHAINISNPPTSVLMQTSSTTKSITIGENASLLSQSGDGIRYLNTQKYGSGGVSITNNGMIASQTGTGVTMSSHDNQTLINNHIIRGGSNAILTSTAITNNWPTTEQAATIINNGLIDGNMTYERSTILTNSGKIIGNINNNKLGVKLTLINNASSGNYASDITGTINMGDHAESSVTINGGSVTGDIQIKNINQQINLNGGSYSGEIYATQDGMGTINVNGNFTLGASSGFGFKKFGNVGTINIANGATLIADGSADTQNLNINANSKLILNNDNFITDNTNVAGTLDFGDNDRSFTGNITGSGTGIINIGSGQHHVTGNLHIKSGDTIAVTLSQAGNVGSIASSHIAKIDAGAKLAITTGKAYQYLRDGSQYKIVSGQEGSIINAIANENINANNSSTNQAFKVLSFSSQAIDNDLYLNVSRAQAQDLTHNQNNQRIYNILDKIGDNASGELQSFQQYIDNSTNATSFNAALQSATPQSDGGTQRNSITTVDNSIRTTEKRMDSIRIAAIRSTTTHPVRLVNPKNTTPTKTYKLTIPSRDYSKVIDNNIMVKNTSKSGIASGDSMINKGIWGQSFGSVGKQNSNSQDGGFRSQSSGIAFGYDQEISKDARLGIAVSYANSRVKSTDKLKRTAVNTYQANIYHGKNFGKYFLDSMIGFAWNEYDSSRSIAAISRNAQAKYTGQSYISKIRTGFIHDINGFNVIPEISLNYVHNRNNNYKENGAGTMNLEVQSSSTHFLEGRAGIKIGYFTKTKNGGQIIPEIRASYGYDFIGDRQTITSNFSGQTATFTSLAAKMDPRSFRAGMGIEFIDINAITLSADYSYERKSEFFSHSGSLKARYDF